MKKTRKIILISVFSILLLGIIFGATDYIRAVNGKKPIFKYHEVNAVTDEQLTVTKYYGLGYIIVMFSNNEKPAFLPFGLGSYAWFIGSNDIDSIDTIKAKKCNNEAKLYYTEANINIYTYCLDSIKITDHYNSFELKDYLKTNTNAIDDIISKFTDNNTNSYDDGGTILYNGDEFNLLKCHTISGNNDIYIGDKNMGYLNDFCGND